MNTALRRSGIALFAGVFLLVSAINFIKPQKASADAILPPCSNTYMETWDWPADIKRGNRSGATDGAGITDFDYANDSYIIYKLKSMDTSSPKRNVFNMQQTTVAQGQIFLTNVAGVPMITQGAGVSQFRYGATIQSEPRKMIGPGYYVWPSGYSDVNTSPSSDSTSNSSLDPTYVACVVAAHNVAYDSSWTWNHFVSNIDFKAGSDAAASCSTLDIACKLKQAWDGIENTFVAVGKAIVDGIASLFMPNATQIKTDFDDLNAFLVAKLGFLTYPFTFLSNVFTAYGSTTNNWCTSSSCTKNFGNLFGRPFTVDLKVGATAYPTYWQYFLDLTRGLLVLGLLLAVRKKYLGVIHK